MEFNYSDEKNRMVPTTSRNAVPPIPYISGFEFGPRGFSCSVPVSSFLPPSVGTNSRETFQQELEKEQMLREKIRREIEKEKIRREIIMSEVKLARRRELEEEVRREMAEELGQIPIQRLPKITFGEPFSMPFNSTMSQFNNNWATNHDSFREHHRQNNEKNKVIVLAKPEASNWGAKRKAVTPLTPLIIHGKEEGSSSWQKKPKKQWSCTLCKISATSEKGLNEHFQGKKHRAKEASSRIPKIGLDSRVDTRNTAAAAANPASQNNTCYEYCC